MPNSSEILDLFADKLVKRGLLIVPRTEWDHLQNNADLRRLQNKLMRKSCLSFGEIIKGKLLNVATRNGIQNKIDTGKINKEEVIPASKNHPKRILASAIKRLMDD